MKVPLLVILLAAAAISCGGTRASAQTTTNLVTNGDFSANAADFKAFPGYTGGTDQYGNTNPTTITDYTAVGSGQLGPNGHSLGAGDPFEPNGYNGNDSGEPVFLFVQVNGGQPTSLTQYISLTAGHSYSLSFDSAGRTYMTANTGAASVSLSNGGTTFFTTPAYVGTDSFMSTAMTFTTPVTTTGLSDLVLSNDYTGTDDITEDFANVSIIDVTPMNPTPEPATYALLGLGALGLFFVRRRSMKTA